MVDLTFVPLAPRKASAAAGSPSKRYPESVEQQVPVFATPSQDPGHMTQPVGETEPRAAPQGEAVEDALGPCPPHVATHGEASDDKKESSETGAGPDAVEPMRDPLTPARPYSLASGPATGANQVALTEVVRAGWGTESHAGHMHPAGPSDISQTAALPEVAGNHSGEGDAPSLRDATQVPGVNPGDSLHCTRPCVDTRLQTLQADMRIREMIRCEAVRLAAIACGRALRRAMLMHPNALAAFVDEAIAAAGHPQDVRLRAHPAIKDELERLGRACGEEAGMDEEEITMETPGGLVRGDPTTCARLLVSAASQADGARAAGLGDV
jgi:hypothetical protein